MAVLLEAIPDMFDTVDQVVFLLSIALCALIGIYFAYFVPTEHSKEVDYLVGSRNMGVFPITMSLVASYISGITLLGVPSEVNVYGCQIMYFNIIYWIVSYVYVEQILPVFYDLQGLSSNEYFLKRFDKRLQLLGSILFVINTLGWLPIVIYVSALAYEQVTGYSIHLVTPVVCLVCIFYTSLGGIKAVIWTDVVQMVSIILCVVLVAVKGTYDVGGIAAVWEKNLVTGRIEAPSVAFDPTVRHTIFGVAIGGFLNLLNSGCLNEGMVQRHQILKSLNHAKRAVWYYTALTVFICFLSGYCGLVIAANYIDCDPVVVHLARRQDQVVPLFVMESFGHIPGLAGLFIAGIFNAALSSMSTSLNTMSAVFLEDWIRGNNIWNPTDHQASVAMKYFVAVAGIIVVALVSVVERLGMVFQMAGSIAAMSTGPTLTVFISGLFLPWVSATGALVGAGVAAIAVAPVMFTTQIYISQNRLQYPAKPIFLEQCTQIYNVSQEFIDSIVVPEETFWPRGPTRGDVWYPFRISYLWYTPVSVACGLTAAAIVTLFVSSTNLKIIDRRLIAPVARRWLPNSDDPPDRGKHKIIDNLDEQDIVTA